MNLQRCQALNGIYNILFYHIRKYVGKNFHLCSPDLLDAYSGVIGKDHFTIINGFFIVCNISRIYQ